MKITPDRIYLHHVEKLLYLVEQNCIKPLSDLLVYSYCLDGLENILRAGEAEKKKPGDVK
ncbi:unnamed protein product [Brassica rapa]|uniref:Uncharacterized protein n=2 Tax=Brassica TaxID=3705 RepID=A0A8D9GMA1_BRACM|nr:unnamed protein product [Brassica napus]CAG7883250.1 unnamed protein product [Brassica rapa]